MNTATPDERTARVCRRPIDMGHPGWILTPLAIPLADFPAVTDPDQARREPELAVFSALAHADGPDAHAVLKALLEGLNALGTSPDETVRERGRMYDDYVDQRLSDEARCILEEIMSTGSYEFRGPTALKFRAEGAAKMIFTVLAARGIAVSDESRARITSCSDPDQLLEWIKRATLADSIEDVFTE